MQQKFLKQILDRHGKEFTGGNFSINTSPLRGDHENSAKYKKLWIQNNIETPDDIVVTGRKETYAKDKASGTPNILIDDRPVNIQKWQAAGGLRNTISSKQRSIKQSSERIGRLWESSAGSIEHTQQVIYQKHRRETERT